MELYNFLCSAVTPLLVLPRVAECWTCGGSFGCAWWCSVSVADRLALPLQGGHSWTRDPLQRTKTNHFVKYQNNNNGNLSCRSWRCPVFQIWPNPNPEVGVKIYLSDSQKITNSRIPVDLLIFIKPSIIQELMTANLFSFMLQLVDVSFFCIRILLKRRFAHHVTSFFK